MHWPKTQITWNPREPRSEQSLAEVVKEVDAVLDEAADLIKRADQVTDTNRSLLLLEEAQQITDGGLQKVMKKRIVGAQGSEESDPIIWLRR